VPGSWRPTFERIQGDAINASSHTSCSGWSTTAHSEMSKSLPPMRRSRRDNRIVAIDVRASKFGFVVLEGPERLLDWSQRNFRRGVNSVKIPAGKKIAALLGEFSPDAVVLKKCFPDRNRKRATLRKHILRQAQLRRIPVRIISPEEVKTAFAGRGRNKYRIASAVALRFPELAPRLPEKHKIWKPEDYRLSIFDAAALGITYFSKSNPSNGLSLTHRPHRGPSIKLRGR